ncbi:MAG TPA: hypothetical protein VIV11_32535 [Kofleriaceae bacterium]
MKRGLLVLCVTSSVAAADASTTARIEAAGACELATLEARTNELLGRVAIVPDASARIAVSTVLAGDTFAASLVFSDAAGVEQSSRAITAASCDELTESIAVVLSLVLRQPEAADASPPPRVAAPAPAVERTDEAPGIAPPPARASTIAIELAGAVGTALDSAVMLGGRLDRSRFGFGVEVAVAMPKSVDAFEGSVHVTSARLAGAGCASLSRFSACGLLTGGVVRGSGEDLMAARSAVAPLVGVGARLEWRQLVSRRTGVRVFGAFEQLLVRPSFLVGDTPVFTSAERQAWLGAGVFLHIP